MSATLFTITPRQFESIVDRVAPMAEKSELLPALTCIRLEGNKAAGTITSTATDRYVVGAAITEVTGVPDFELLLKVADLKTARRLFPAPRRFSTEHPITVQITADGGSVHLFQKEGYPQISIGLEVHNDLTFPRLREHLDGWQRQQLPPTTLREGAWGVSPKFLSRFAHLGDRLLLQPTDDGIGPILVYADHFLGALMTTRPPEQETLRDLWAPPAPPEKRKAKVS